MLHAVHYIEFLGPSGEPAQEPECYQPYFIGETRIFDGKSFHFSPFTISGELSTGGNESGDYELVAPANIISTARLWQASEDLQLVKIYTVLLIGSLPSSEQGIPTWTESSYLSATVCVCDSFTYADAVPGEEENFSPVTLRLTNALNYVAGTAPSLRLTAAQVGPLPSSGGITF